MSSTTTSERRRSRFDSRRRPRRGVPRKPSRPAPERGPRTLEELITTTIERMATGPAACPVCAQPQLTTAGCGACGSHLS